MMPHLTVCCVLHFGMALFISSAAAHIELSYASTSGPVHAASNATLLAKR